MHGTDAVFFFLRASEEITMKSHCISKAFNRRQNNVWIVNKTNAALVAGALYLMRFNGAEASLSGFKAAALPEPQIALDPFHVGAHRRDVIPVLLDKESRLNGDENPAKFSDSLPEIGKAGASFSPKVKSMSNQPAKSSPSGGPERDVQWSDLHWMWITAVTSLLTGLFLSLLNTWLAERKKRNNDKN
jgi:hypothetical protein